MAKRKDSFTPLIDAIWKLKIGKLNLTKQEANAIVNELAPLRSEVSAATPKPAPTSVKEFFEQFRDLLRSTPVAYEVMSVFSAMRGPDNNSWPLKHAFTEIIRTTALGELAPTAGAYEHYDGLRNALDRKNFLKTQGNTHFVSHAFWAFQALGLKLHEPNGHFNYKTNRWEEDELKSAVPPVEPTSNAENKS